MSGGAIHAVVKDAFRVHWKKLLWLLPLIGFLFSLSLMPYQVDDAYITYRYAWNFASGEGLVYNSGQVPSEGFSSPMWMLLLSLGAGFLSMEALPFWGMFLGLIAFTGLLGLFGYLSRDEEPGIRILMMLVLALWPGFVFYASTGMEMLLFSVCVLLVHSAALGMQKQGLGMTAAILAIWIRPEAAWIPVALMASFLPFILLRRRLLSRSVIKLLMGMVTGGLILLAFRWLIFGQLLPNTYYAKIPVYAQGLAYVGEFALSPSGFCLIVLAVAGAWLGKVRHRSYLVSGLVWMIAPVLEGGDWMPHHRFLLPAVLFLILAVSGLAQAQRKGIIRATGALFLVLVGMIVWQDCRMHRHARYSYDTLTVRERAIADWARENGIVSIAGVDIGVMGYYSQAEITDIVGLTDPRISRSKGGHLSKKFNLDYVFAERRPGCIVLRSTIVPQIEGGRLKRCRPGSEIERRLFSDPRLLSEYRLVMSLEVRDNPRQSKLIFLRGDLPLPPLSAPVQRLVF